LNFLYALTGSTGTLTKINDALVLILQEPPIHIESFGATSPIIVVLNKMDQNPAFDVNRRFLQDKYQGIVNFCKISCGTGEGIKEVQDILKNTLSKVELSSTAWPAEWFRVKEQLEGMGDHFISQEEYFKLCGKEGVTDNSTKNTLVQFLHDLGIIVHFEDLPLKDMYVLEPTWITKGVYTIITSKHLVDNHGVLYLKSLGKILQTAEGYDFPSDKHVFLVELMKKFRLCFPIDDKRLLVPDLLDIQEPEIEFDYDECVLFRLDYQFLPKSIITSFIVKKHKSIVKKLCWRTGVVLSDKDFKTTALIRADEEKKRIHIFISGSQRREYLAVLRAAFLEINDQFEKLGVEELVFAPDDTNVAVKYLHLLALQEHQGNQPFLPIDGKRTYQIEEFWGALYPSSSSTLDERETFINDVGEKVIVDTEKKERFTDTLLKIFPLKIPIVSDIIDIHAILQLISDKDKKRSKKKAKKN